MEPSGSEVAASSAGRREDRISALPDELLVTILLFLSNAADAARTSVLSTRWRTVWTLLPDLRVPFFPEPHSFRRALRASALHLRRLKLEGDGAAPKSLEIWLPDAARRLCGGGTLHLVNRAPGPAAARPDLEDGDEMIPPSWLRMPCFETAAEIRLDLGFLRLIMPSEGVFARLTVLVLERVRIEGTRGFNLVLSPPRCPCLQVLKIRDSRDLRYLFIDSGSLLELELVYLDSLWQLKVEAPVLRRLVMVSCFIEDTSMLVDPPIVSTVSAPQLVFLYWRGSLDPRCVAFGPMPRLQIIGGMSYSVYGIQGPGFTLPLDNSALLKLLQPLKAVESLDLVLTYVQKLDNYQYMMEDMKVLPNPATLNLSVHANGHSFGASAFHVLRRCLGIKELELELSDNIHAEAQTPCLPGCVCDEETNWKAEELLLTNLQEIKILLLRGSEHEVSFVRRLLNSATTLKKMTVFLSRSTTESNAKELYEMFKSLSKAEIHMELIYGNRTKVLYAT